MPSPLGYTHMVDSGVPTPATVNPRPLPAGLACWQCEGLRAADGTRTRIPRTDGREVAFSAPPSPAGVRYLTSRQRPDAFVRAVTHDLSTVATCPVVGKGAGVANPTLRSVA